MTVLSLSSSSPRAISSVFIHRIILQRDSGRPAAQPTDTFAAGRDSLPAFPEALQRAEDGEEDGRGGGSCHGRPSEAAAEAEEGRSAQNVTPLPLSRTIHGGWRGEFCTSAALLGRNGGFQVWSDAAGADEGTMLMKPLPR